MNHTWKWELEMHILIGFLPLVTCSFIGNCCDHIHFQFWVLSHQENHSSSHWLIVPGCQTYYKAIAPSNFLTDDNCCLSEPMQCPAENVSIPQYCCQRVLVTIGGEDSCWLLPTLMTALLSSQSSTILKTMTRGQVPSRLQHLSSLMKLSSVHCKTILDRQTLFLIITSDHCDAS